MLSVEWHGDQDVRVVRRPAPRITQPKDAIIRITSTTICGSDLHLYHNEVPGLHKGDILGHEAIGFVEAVGEQVQNIAVGDRVVISAVISCGECFYCLHEMFACCDITNPERLSSFPGIFGYTKLAGGYDGCQAEYVRVPFADINCLKVPPHLTDEQVLLLSDVACTAYQGVEYGGVKEGQVVAIWGCGPVGLLAIQFCKLKKARRVIAIDSEPFRLEMAGKLGAETINLKEKEVTSAITEICNEGPDVCIEVVGFRIPKSEAPIIEINTSNSPVNQCIRSCRKGGTISVVGVYLGDADKFPIGQFFEKNLKMASGVVSVQKWWKQLLEYIESGKVDITWALTHKMSLDKAAEAYRMFDRKEDNIIKVLLQTSPVTSE